MFTFCTLQPSTRMVNSVKNYIHVRESLFNMTRWDEDIEGWLRKFLDSRKGGSEKIREGLRKLYTLKPTGGGTPKKLNR